MFFSLLKDLKTNLASAKCEVTHIRAGVWQALVRINTNSAHQEARLDIDRPKAIAEKAERTPKDLRPTNAATPALASTMHCLNKPAHAHDHTKMPHTSNSW